MDPKLMEEQIKHLKAIIKLNEEQNENQKKLIEQLKQVIIMKISKFRLNFHLDSNWNLKKRILQNFLKKKSRWLKRTIS